MTIICEVEDLGVHAEQYWQGVGVAYTEWDVVYSGIGATLREAIEDALDGAATAGVECDLTFEDMEFTPEALDRAIDPDAPDDVHHYAAVFAREE